MGSFLFGLTALLFSFNVLAAMPGEALFERAREKRLSEHEQWRNLVHYKNSLFGNPVSQADGRLFFLADDGKTNPESELEATIRAFYATKIPEIVSHDSGSPKYTETELKTLAQHPICRFPARLRFLKRELGWDGSDLPKVNCALYDDFVRRVDARSASLVFSSFFLNNPSSTFGHSFLRLNSGLWQNFGGARNELLDTGINYAANPTVTNPVLYALFGMVGLFPGTFTAVPYYYKVREYNDFESRDLWSYDLNLTEDELKMLVDHIWEEGATYYDYLYFTENCSYHMFTLLDAAAPQYRLADRLPLAVIPSNTIRVLYSVPGLVTKVSYRPSVRAQLKHRLTTFTKEEERALSQLVENENPENLSSEMSAETKAKILDAYSDQVELAKADDLVKEGSAAQKLKQRILLSRAKLGVKSPSLEVPMSDDTAPHIARGTRRFELGYGHETSKNALTENYVSFGHRFAMVDLLDPGPGYPRNMHVDFASFRARYRLSDRELEWDEIHVFKMTALTPLHPYYPSKSMRVELGAKKWVDAECEHEDRRCLVSVVEGGPGITIAFDRAERFNLFGFANMKLAYTPKFLGANVRASIGPRVGTTFYFTDRMNAMIAAEGDLRAFTVERSTAYLLEAGLRFGIGKVWALDLKALKDREREEGQVQLFYYY